MKSILIKGAKIVNEGKIFSGDVLVKDGRIAKISKKEITAEADITIKAKGKFLLPGVIDDQVHFREPGFTHKAEIYTEAKAAVAGGTTSFMEMPNTNPQTLTQELLEEKYKIGAKRSLANYSFFMGASNDNLDEVLKTDPKTVCGIKVFMGSSTGNMLVDDQKTLEKLFKNSKMLIATHCEYEPLIQKNTEQYIAKYGEDIPFECHPEIRNEEACYISSSLAVGLAKKHNTRLHILHLTTKDELELFTNKIPLKEKRITAEVCVHHLTFDSSDYEKLGSLIKCNPAIKGKVHKKALWKGLLDDKLDIIATDHAPHTLKEKKNKYLKAPAGLPLVQHSLDLMLKHHKRGRISLEKLVEKMCHAPADCFQVEERGYIREGYWADLVLVDLSKGYKVSNKDVHYKCQWTPLDGKKMYSKVTHTIVSGHLAYAKGKFDESQMGQRLTFDRG